MFFYYHDHHILSKALFGKGKTVKLCPNCHTHFHEYKKIHETDPENKKEAKKIWRTWYTKVSVTFIITAIAILFIINEFYLQTPLF